MLPRRISCRRDFLKLTTLGAASLAALAACGGTAATPTTAPAAKATTAPAAAATTAPAAVATTAPAAGAASPTAAAKPAEATKPAAAATSPASASPTAAAKPATKATGTLDWWVPNFHAEGAKVYKPKFEAANPNIKINQIETVSQGLLEKITATLQGNTQPDLIDVANGWNPIFSKAALVKELTSYNLPVSDWLPGPIATAQLDGKLFGVPFRSEAIALCWNQGLFEASGLTATKPPSTWEELTEMALKANKPPERYGFGVVAGDPGNSFFRMATFIWANDGDVLNPTYTEAVCNQPACVEAVQFYTDLVTKHKVAPEIALTATTEQMDQLFSANKLAIHLTGQYILPRLQKEAPNLKWAATPTLKRKKIAGPLGGWNWVIPKNAKNPDAAWAFIDFIVNNPENMAEYASLLGVFPSRKNALSNKLFSDNKSLAPFAEQLQYARATPPIQQWGDVQKAFVTQVQSVIAGQKTVQAAMDTAAADINKLVKPA